MPIKQEVVQKRICDLCGKEEGKQLKSTGFFSEAPRLVVKNHVGTPITFQLKVDVYKNIRDDVESKLLDIIESHNIQNCHAEGIVNLIPVEAIHQQIAMATQTQEENVICKTCYNALVTMIKNHGKFDKVEVF